MGERGACGRRWLPRTVLVLLFIGTASLAYVPGASSADDAWSDRGPGWPDRFSLALIGDVFVHGRYPVRRVLVTPTWAAPTTRRVLPSQATAAEGSTPAWLASAPPSLVRPDDARDLRARRALVGRWGDPHPPVGAPS